MAGQSAKMVPVLRGEISNTQSRNEWDLFYDNDTELNLHICAVITFQGTPLKIACEHGYLHIVDMLLCNKTPLPDPVPESCDCPFFTVAYYGWVDILDILLKYKSGQIITLISILTVRTNGSSHMFAKS